MARPTFPAFKDVSGPGGWIASIKAYIDWILTPDTNTIAATSYVPVLTDLGLFMDFTAVTAITFTIPLNATVNFPINAILEGLQVAAGQITIVGAAGVAVHFPTGKTGKTTGQWSSFFARQRALNDWVIGGDIV